MRNKQRGFTLMELAVVMAIMGVLAALNTPNIVNELNQRRSDIAAQETQQIVDAARSYRVAKGVWPGDSTCSNALGVLTTASPAYLGAVGPNNRFNSLYSTSCTTNSFSVDQYTVADWDGYVANSLASTTVVNASTHQIRTTVGLPGSEPALDSKLSRVATGNAELNRMRTDLLMGGNNISEINALTANSARITSLNTDQAVVNGTLTAANGTITTLIAGTGNITTVNANQAVLNEMSANSGSITNLNTSTTRANEIYANSGSITNLGTANLSASQAAIFNGILAVGGESQFNGKSTFNSDVVLNKVVAENTGCAPNGAIARNAAGMTLSCQSGVWKGGGMNLGTEVYTGMTGYDVKDGGTTTYDTNCPAGKVMTGLRNVTWGDYFILICR
ncbi:shufflon system plasmid conjugative transfer pilus tip adhesin PilV [Pseudomonas syringae pv. actinidiae]|nr:shufflon system plasmid conjugative transfer pilus tip adhesin PilV [Pseudomonas syringae pv. actinidiae]